MADLLKKLNALNPWSPESNFYWDTVIKGIIVNPHIFDISSGSYSQIGFMGVNDSIPKIIDFYGNLPLGGEDEIKGKEASFKERIKRDLLSQILIIDGTKWKSKLPLKEAKNIKNEASKIMPSYDPNELISRRDLTYINHRSRDES